MNARKQRLVTEKNEVRAEERIILGNKIGAVVRLSSDRL